MTQTPSEPYPHSGLPHHPHHNPHQTPLPQPPPSQKLAIWSLVLAVIPLPVLLIASAVLAIIVISRSKDGRQHGKTMAVTALVLVGLWVVAIAVAVTLVVAEGADRDSAGRVTDGGRVSFADLRSGDCLGLQETEVVQYSVPVVPCGDPHESEVFAKFALSGAWSDAEQVMRTSETGCIDRFPDYVGVGYDQSSLSITFFHPTDRSGYATDPSVVCLLVSPKPVTETLKLSKR